MNELLRLEEFHQFMSNPVGKKLLQISKKRLLFFTYKEIFVLDSNSFSFEIRKLSSHFYSDYSRDSYPEIRDEYVETQKNIQKIYTHAVAYLNEYVKFVNGNSSLSPEELRRRYQFSTLKYFHDILHLPKL